MLWLSLINLILCVYICTHVNKCRVSFFKAFVQFIGTAILNNSNYLSRKHSTTCYVEKRRFFFAAAIWCIITLILSLSSYAFYACTSEAQHRNVNLQRTADSDVGVAMGQPHMRHMQMSKDQCWCQYVILKIVVIIYKKCHWNMNS